MAILLFIGLSFYTVTRLERKTAANTANTIRAELLADGALAIAMAFLQNDFNAHPTTTSIDHAWRTYFNGSWAVGKPWLWQGGYPIVTGHQPGVVPGLPLVPNAPGIALDQWLYVPRIHRILSETFDSTTSQGPVARETYDHVNAEFDFQFVNSHDYDVALVNALGNPVNEYTGRFLSETLFYDEQIDFWTDVDNDGDGLNDSIWIPMQLDRQYPDDGIDNDMDGWIDESPAWATDGLDNNGDGVVDDAAEVHTAELGLFLYSETPDNPNVGLTSPLIAENGDFVEGGPGDQFHDWTTELFVPHFNLYHSGGKVFAGVDDRDNDYDLVVNSTPGYSFPIPPEMLAVPQEFRWNPYLSFQYLQSQGVPAADLNALRQRMDPHLKRSFNFIRNPVPINQNRYLSFAGEPVCEIVGRMAVKITDEASKVNVNVAHSLTLNDAWFFTDQRGAGPMRRVLSRGRSPREYDMRFMPQIGPARANHIATLRTGASGGIGLSTWVDGGGFQIPTNTTVPANSPEESTAYAYDVSLPGFGLVDDVGSALWLAMDGLDNTGDGIIDKGINPNYPQYFGAFEGIDDPDEHQLHRPLRNYLAENDRRDNDGQVDQSGAVQSDNVTDEIGELGDNYLRTNQQIKLAFQHEPFWLGDYNRWRNLFTVHSSDKNGRTKYVEPRSEPGIAAATKDGIVGLIQPLEKPLWQDTANKAHYNFASAEQIAQQLKIDWGYTPTLSTGIDVNGNWGPNPSARHAYLRGGRVEGTGLFDLHGLPDALGAPVYIDGYPRAQSGDALPWFADLELHAAQLAANIVDSRDKDHVRTETQIRINDLWWQEILPGAAIAPRDITYTVAGTEAIRINEIMVRPTRRIEAEVITTLPSPYTAEPTAALGIGTLNFDVPPFQTVATFPEFLMSHAVRATANQAFIDHPYDGVGVGTVDGNAVFPLGSQSAFGLMTPIGVGGETNLLEFVFLPSPGLPPGNYYLTLNTLDATLQPSVLDPNNLRFLMKYAAVGDTIVADFTGIAIPDDRGFAPLAYTNPADGLNAARVQEQGNLLLSRMRLPNPLDDPNDPAVLPLEYQPGTRPFTVEIPGYDSVDGSGNPLALHVAVWIPTTATAPAAINYFEFSQEPHHEWIEVVNVADYSFDPTAPEEAIAAQLNAQIVDISGWELRIGSGGGSEGLFRVPDIAPVRIAPGGSVLLGFDKTNLLGTGMALAPVGGATVPPIPPIDPDPVSSNFNTTLASGAGARNVFLGTLDAAGDVIDFVDADGDGEDDPFSPHDVVVTNVADSGVDPRSLGDRIVQLQPLGANDVIDLTASNVDQQIANLVLRGGFLPNYPERDGIDNDGDNAILTADLFDNNRNALLLNTDGGAVPSGAGDLGLDEPLEGIDEGRSKYVLPFAGTYDALNDIYISSPPDGVVYRPLAGGAYSTVSYPVLPHNGLFDGTVFRAGGATYDPITGIYTGPSGATHNVGFPPFFTAYFSPQPGAYNLYGLNYSFAFALLDPATSFVDDPENTTARPVEAYMGSVAQEENTRYEMKAFLERKMFPGDNVVVTLYAGSADDTRIADRVTYNERDVINTRIDDGIVCPQFITLPLPTPLPVPVTLDHDVTLVSSRLWPDDTMGVDFYRSLERKHALYPGDLHGTTNRWEATDGNYDDWGPPAPQSLVLLEPLLYGHAYQGSPLRMNYWQRVREHPFRASDAADLYTAGMHVPDEDRWKFWESLPDAPPGRPWPQLTEFHKPKVGVRNGLYDSLGDLLRLPDFTMARFLAAFTPGLDLPQEFITGYGILDAPALNHPMANSAVKFRANLQPLLPEDSLDNNFNLTRGFDALAVLSGVVEQPLILNAGQAEYDAPDGLAPGDEPQWGLNGNLPRGWAPVHLIEMADGFDDSQTNNILSFVNQHRFLSPLEAGNYTRTHNIFDFGEMIANVPSFAANVTQEELNKRWGPMNTRVMYVSGNAGFIEPPASEDPPPLVSDPIAQNLSQALFVWRGVSALVDGKYDVYVDVGGDLGPLQDLARFPKLLPNSPTATTATLFSDFGRALMQQPLHRREQMRIGLNFYTDSAGFRRNQPIDFDRPGDFGDLAPETGGAAPASYNVFTPDKNGLIYYGEVDVRNSYLAMRMANYSNPGEIARFARVILTPAKRTEGRININTAITTLTDTSADPPLYNTLAGIPGIFLKLDVAGNLEEDRPANRTPTPTNPDADLPGVLLMSEARNPNEPALMRRSHMFDAVPVNWGQHQAIQKAETLVDRRTYYADGRYFNWVPHLLGYAEPIRSGNPLQSPMSDDAGELRYKELSERYPRLANMVTTRSDVFEIIVTVQGGFIIDEDGDGVLNYRDDREFNALSEKKTRTVYSRR